MAQPGSNGDVNFNQAANDARGDKGTVGLGLPFFNEYRGPFGGAAGGPLFNEYRCSNMEDGDVMRVQTDRKVS